MCFSSKSNRPDYTTTRPKLIAESETLSPVPSPQPPEESIAEFVLIVSSEIDFVRVLELLRLCVSNRLSQIMEHILKTTSFAQVAIEARGILFQ